MAIAINQHVSRGELEVSIHKLWDNPEDQTCTLMLKGDGAEICIYLNAKQIEEIAGKAMAYLMPELVTK
jgi:hypothetical protein